MLSQIPRFHFQRMAPMQLVVPNAVIAAVMMLAISWRIALHVSFFPIFVIVYCLPFTVYR